jgi:hypothetical protein
MLFHGGETIMDQVDRGVVPVVSILTAQGQTSVSADARALSPGLGKRVEERRRSVSV